MQIIELNQENIYKGPLILVNKDHPYHQKKNQFFTNDISQLLKMVFDKIGMNDEIMIVSGYRSLKEQEDIYQHSMIENGKEYTFKYVALPHCSEHETGLAVDLALRKENIDFICPDFPNTGICQAFRETSYHYGFIERYQKDKENQTHIGYEPWHFRYVGFPHSMIMQEKNLCLEEYHEFIKQFTLYKPYQYIIDSKIIEIFYVPLTYSQTICLKDDLYYQISGNNIDGVIITTWRVCL